MNKGRAHSALASKPGGFMVDIRYSIFGGDKQPRSNIQNPLSVQLTAPGPGYRAGGHDPIITARSAAAAVNSRAQSSLSINGRQMAARLRTCHHRSSRHRGFSPVPAPVLVRYRPSPTRPDPVAPAVRQPSVCPSPSPAAPASRVVGSGDIAQHRCRHPPPACMTPSPSPYAHTAGHTSRHGPPSDARLVCVT